MKKSKVFIVVLVFTSLFMFVQIAHADVAPPSQPAGSNVVPGEVTMVQMVYERVVIDLRPPWSDGVDADVTAIFTMRNQGTIDEEMTVGFPLNRIDNMNIDGSLPRLKDLVVKVNGSLVPVQYPDSDDWLVNDPGNLLAMDWAVFEVVFPVGQEVIIEINYKQPPTYDAPTTQYDYTLITGAGWFGPILEGDIIFRLPYTISFFENYWTMDMENVWGGIASEVIIENEVRWHFENLEPQGGQDNWRVHIIRPRDWERILSVREALVDNQYNSDLWMELGDAYSNAAVALGGKTYDSSYQAIAAYQQSVALNPDGAEAHAKLAVEYYKAYNDAGFYASGDDLELKSLQQAALQELSVALALDTNNEIALGLLEELKIIGSGWDVLPPPTPFATPTFGARVITAPTATSTPVVVTVVHTKIVNASMATILPKPTATSAPTATQIQDGSQEEAGASAMFLSVLVIFVAGIGSGWFLSKRQIK